jgi:hypothetical protein
MQVLGSSSMPQPKNLFTKATYKELLEQYWEFDKEDDTLSYQNPARRERKDLLRQQLSALRRQYRGGLPVYLLARCPMCGGRVWEPIDSYSLNGMGWVGLKTGFGWYGSISLPDEKGMPGQSARASYEAECKHVEVVVFCVNLNGLQPDDVRQEVWIGPEKPFVMQPLMEVDRTFVVIHSLPIGRYDDPDLVPRYTAYFMAYFSGNQKAFSEAIGPFDRARSRIQYAAADYDLLKWIEAGKLFWLDTDVPELPLRNEPLRMFPYAGVQGKEGLCVIRDGRLKVYLSLNRRQKKPSAGRQEG